MSVLTDDAQDVRLARALREVVDYEWRPLGSGHWQCQSPKGALHIVTERGPCSCADYQFRLVGTPTLCKHGIALRHRLLAETQPKLPPDLPASIATAFQQGYRAYQHARSRDINPHCGPEFFAWDSGWQEARDEATQPEPLTPPAEPEERRRWCHKCGRRTRRCWRFGHQEAR